MKISYFILPILLLQACDSKKESTEEVTQSASTWEEFHYPEVEFVLDDPQGRAKNFKEFVPDLEELIKEEALAVSKILYEKPNEVPRVDSVIYTVCEFEGLSGKGGVRPIIHFVFGSQYFATMLDSLDKEAIREEIIGVMVHEVAHAYQKDCKYEGDGWSVIEGIADAVRYLEGYVDLSHQKVGGSYQDGYKTTGFFMVWIMQNKDKDFLKKLNKSLEENYDWKWDENILNLTGQSVDSLWEEYQNYLQTNEAAAPLS
ncbi:basic secretory protein-like protein [Reichenbachiella sp.]|uniref:basic secretory protein-like protein n=1 Tax=Reichenbachiella sp. TaxID=2184521 RepID=UPI003BB111BC